jgi:hypothetical protein
LQISKPFSADMPQIGTRSSATAKSPPVRRGKPVNCR